MELNQKEREILFSTIQKPLTDLLDAFERDEYYNTAVHYISGGFAHAEYDDMDDTYVYFTLKWGVQSDCENRVNTEQYKVSLSNLIFPYEKGQELIKYIEDA